MSMFGILEVFVVNIPLLTALDGKGSGSFTCSSPILYVVFGQGCSEPSRSPKRSKITDKTE